MNKRCDICGEITNVSFEFKSVFANYYTLYLCHWCGDDVKEFIDKKREGIDDRCV